ncbi:hypothetical protein K2173_007141 [Erythroxylum novogranatense]|uniref:1-deoxy-D-xylulose 5-phosphate reductoisomerase N-terminal domain-containing protein n=1 Tax=Erythroxylum novogranatense TaxID=1862640 RepID=A0AAV8T037_9ROSI|nr:hypothetical protein K2173_007141 [Erythroxylum novogranatense]
MAFNLLSLPELKSISFLNSTKSNYKLLKRPEIVSITLTLDIVAENPDKFRVVALAAPSNVTLLADQVKTFKPQLVAIRNGSLVDELKEALGDLEEKPEIVPGEQRIIEVARHPDVASVVTSIVGCAGLKHQVRGIVCYDILGFSYSQK